MHLELQLPGGGVCGWTAADEAAEAVLDKLRSAASLRVGGETREGDCILSSWHAHPRNEADYWRGFACRIGKREFCIGDWSRLSDRTRGVLLRQIFFHGLLPLLLNGDCAMVHCALCGEEGGFIVCGPSGMGKSTLFRKLTEAGWRLPSDDCALLSRVDGRWVAQPTPTWSLWLTGKPRPVDVFETYGVKSAYFLERGSDALLPVNRAEALRALTPATCDLPRLLSSGLGRECAVTLMRNGFSFAEQMAETLQVRRLAATLTGDSARIIKEGNLS